MATKKPAAKPSKATKGGSASAADAKSFMTTFLKLVHQKSDFGKALALLDASLVSVIDREGLLSQAALADADGKEEAKGRLLVAMVELGADPNAEGGALGALSEFEDEAEAARLFA